MEKGKINIVRSFSRKINLGNYETADFFSSRGQEVEDDTPLADQQTISKDLFLLAMTDVERDMKGYLAMQGLDSGVDIHKLCEIIDKVSVGKPILVEDFETLNPIQAKIIQSVKRAYKRSPMAKEKEVIRGPRKEE